MVVALVRSSYGLGFPMTLGPPGANPQLGVFNVTYVHPKVFPVLNWIYRQARVL